MSETAAARRKKGARKPFVMVDGSSYLYRAFHALPPLTNARGEPTGAVYGVVNMLLKLLDEYQPDHVAVLFDAKGKTFRDDLYEEYKAQRPPMPGELRAQLEPLHAIVRALGLPLLQVEGVEADDVIGTLARRASEAGLDTVISTIDKDMAQLVDERVTLVNTMFDTVLDPEGVRVKFGVDPGQIVDFIALVGDTSDNIPGVPRVGKKTAAKWLNEYGSVEALVAHAGDIKGKVGESLREHLEQLELSCKLAEIRCDVELDTAPEDLARKPPDVAALRKLYRDLDFGTLLAKLPRDGEEAEPGPAEAPDASYSTVTTETALEELVETLDGAAVIGLDVQTSGTDYMEAQIVGLACAWEPGRAAYVPLAHDYPGAPDQLDRDAALERLRALLESDEAIKAGHNVKLIAHAFTRHGIALGGARHDPMLESYVLDSTATRHDLDAIAQKYLGRAKQHYEDVAGKGAKQLGFSEVAVDDAAGYAAQAADVALQAHAVLRGRLEKQPPLAKLYDEIEQPLVPVLQRMEQAGVLIDVAQLEAHSAELAERMKQLEAVAYEEAGAPFNLGSPKQLQHVLFEVLDLPVRRKTPKGQPSTAEDVLQELAHEYRLPALIMEHRAVSKLKSTYTDNLPRQVNPRTGRVHTSYHQAVAATGRLSSADPNLQNIPVRTPEGRRIRQAFVAEEGHVLLAADYSQIELRIMAHLSGDDGLLRAFADDDDIHRATAAEVFGLEPDEVDPEQRRSAKAINFGLIYGMSAFGLARQLGIARRAAQEYVDLYFERYPGVKAFMDRTREEARERGYVETVFGRRLYLPEIRGRNAQRRQYAERSAINAPMQGTAADIIKRAMITLDAMLQEGRLRARLIMQVHDELVLEVAREDVEELRSETCRRMVEAADLAVPLKVDARFGASWDEAH